MNLKSEVARVLEQETGLERGGLIVVGVSGGADSLCLLHLMKSMDLDVIAAHLDHDLRPESTSEAEYVRQLCLEWEIPFASEKGGVRELAARPGTSLEEAARLVRYRFLLRVATEQAATAIATAHTMDDQAETIVMHFLRGSGPGGLRGMLPAQDLGAWAGRPDGSGVTLVRPLLRVRRAQTAGYCAAQGLRPVEDPMNFDRAMLRSRLRHELIPLLEAYNPGVVETLGRTGEVMRALSLHLEAEVEGHYSQLARQAGTGAIAMRREPFLALDRALQRELLRYGIARLLPHMRDVGFAQVESALDFIVEGKRGRASLVHGLSLEAIGDELVLADGSARLEFPQFPQLASALTLGEEGQWALEHGWSLELRRIGLTPAERDDVLSGRGQAAEKNTELFVPTELSDDLHLRPPRDGDRFRPLGMQGSMRLSEFFINERIPRRARKRWPLLASGNKILWVLGLRRSNCARITASTEAALMARLTRSNPETAGRFAGSSGTSLPISQTEGQEAESPP